MRRALRVLIAASLLLAVFVASGGGVASAADTCTVDTTDDVGTLADLCSIDTTDVGVADCGGGGGSGGGGGGC